MGGVPTTADDWSWEVTGGGGIDPGSGRFTATMAGGPFTVTATSTLDGTIRSTAEVTVVDALTVPSGNLAQGGLATASAQASDTYGPRTAVGRLGSTRRSSGRTD